MLNAFYRYTDPNNYHFLQVVWDVSASGGILWHCYAPDSFNILLYFPETDSFVSSEIIDEVTYQSYYTVEMTGLTMDSVALDEARSKDEKTANAEELKAQRKENPRWEVFSFALRVLTTIAAEMAIASLFGFREKRQRFLLAAVIIPTQIVLNLLLSRIYYGLFGFGILWNYAAAYFRFASVRFVVEAVIYCIFMRKVLARPGKKQRCLLYAWVANTVSFVVGLAASLAIPGIFY